MNRVIELPFPQNIEVSDLEIKTIVAAKLFEIGKLSAGQAAEIFGLSKRIFLKTLGNTMFQFLATPKLKWQEI